MKKVILAAIVMATISFMACNSSSEKSNEKGTQQFACVMHPEVVGKKGDKCSKCGMELTEPVAAKETTNASKASTAKTTFTTTEIINNYLALKNALTKDDTKAAAASGKDLFEAFNKVNTTGIGMKEMYLEMADDAKEHAEHIGDNEGKLEHQREHFVLLSKDVSEIILMFGSSQKLYQDFCPMADDGKGAIWISEVKEIKNPYLGAKKPNCGSLKEEYPNEKK